MFKITKLFADKGLFSIVAGLPSTGALLKGMAGVLERYNRLLNRFADQAAEEEFRVIKHTIMSLISFLLILIHRLSTVFLILTHRLLTAFLIMLQLLFSFLAHAQADTVRPGKGHLLTSVLKPGLRQYLVTFQNPKQPRSLGFWYWMRDIQVINREGKKVFAITQHWYGADTSAYRSVYSLNATEDFAPFYHSESVRGKTAAYNWKADGITGADTVEGNARKAFSFSFGEPNFNWNLDIETFEMLPLAAGKSFLINFYDAGLDSPRYVLYKVTGSEELALLNGEKTDCWKLHAEETNPKGGSFSETYWISKKGHEFLKEDDAFNGMFRYKIKMPALTPDLLPRFTP